MAEVAAPREVAAARVYLGVQAVAGALWWVGVFTADAVRVWTLGGWDPRVLVGPDLLLFVGGSALAAARSSWRVAAVTAVWTTALAVALAAYGLVERAAGWGVLLMAAAALGSLAAAATLRDGRMPRSWFFVGPFRFRVAAVGPGRRHLLASLAQLVVFWSTFFLLVPVVLGWVEDRLRVSWTVLDDGRWDVVGTVLLVLGSAAGLWSCLTMALRGRGTPLPAATARELVVSGPYRFVRNPMAAAGVVQSVGVGLVVGSWTMVAVALAGAVAWHVGIRPLEEADLQARFGEAYAGYRSRVRCWVPRVGPA